MVAPCPLREQTRWSKNSSARSGAITLAALHESVGGTEAVSLAMFCERAGVSYHAIADNDKIVYAVPRSRKAWHLRNGNPRADGLCLCTPVSGYSRAQWLGPQLNKVKVAGWWLAIICADRGIDVEQCSLQNVRDALRGSRAAGGVTTHDDYTKATRDGTHNDPRNFPVDVALQYAREYARGSAPSPTAPTAAPVDATHPLLVVSSPMMHDPGAPHATDGPIWRAQDRLKRGYRSYAGHLDLDGFYGDQTADVIAEFQRRSRLPVNRKVDAATWRALGL